MSQRAKDIFSHRQEECYKASVLFHGAKRDREEAEEQEKKAEEQLRIAKKRTELAKAEEKKTENKLRIATNLAMGAQKTVEFWAQREKNATENAHGQLFTH